MEEHLVPYFTAEKQEALLFMLVGLAALAVSAYLMVTRSRLRAMAFPLTAIAGIQLVVGATVYFRTDAQVAALQAQYAESPDAFRAEETARMQVVVRNFRIYKYIEIALLATGVGLMMFGGGMTHRFAVGFGLSLQSALMLVLDLFAEARADVYLAFVSGA